MIQSKVISKNVSHNILQGIVRAADSDLDHSWRSQSRRMATILSDTVICHSPWCYTQSMQIFPFCRLFIGRYSHFSLLQNLWTTLYVWYLKLSREQRHVAQQTRYQTVGLQIFTDRVNCPCPKIWKNFKCNICFNSTHRTSRSQSTHSQEPCE